MKQNSLSPTQNWNNKLYCQIGSILVFPLSSVCLAWMQFFSARSISKRNTIQFTTYNPLFMRCCTTHILRANIFAHSHTRTHHGQRKSDTSVGNNWMQPNDSKTPNKLDSYLIKFFTRSLHISTERLVSFSFSSSCLRDFDTCRENGVS